MVPFLADVGSPVIGLLSGLVVAGFGLAGVLYRGRRIEIPTAEANSIKAKADAAVSNAEAAGKWLQNQQTYIDGLTKQTEEAQRQALLAQSAASAARDAAEDAKRRLSEALTQAAKREHDLVGETLIRDGKIRSLERDKESQAQEIRLLKDEVGSLRAQLGQIERRRP